MVYQFKVVSDGSLWAIDSGKLRYARLSRPLEDAFKNPSEESAVEEFGKLIQMNPLIRLYRLEGRTPDTDGPGGGLASVVVDLDIPDTVLEVGISANVPISDPICVKPIERVSCTVLGQQSIH